MLRLLNDKGEPWIVYLRVSDALYLELFPGGRAARSPDPGAPASRISASPPRISTPPRRGSGDQGIALSQPRKPGRGVDGNRGMWIEDPDGNRIEIMEMAPDCIQFRAVANLRAGRRAGGAGASLTRNERLPR